MENAKAWLGVVMILAGAMCGAAAVYAIATGMMAWPWSFSVMAAFWSASHIWADDE